MSTHVIDPLFEELTFLVTSCVEIIKLLQRQVVNCPVWDCTRTTIIMGRCQVCMQRTVTLLVDTVQLIAAFTETHTMSALVRPAKVPCTLGITLVETWLV